MAVDKSGASNGAAKRALWEVRQRYRLSKHYQNGAGRPPNRPASPAERTDGLPYPPSPLLPRRKKNWRRRLIILTVVLIALGIIFGYRILAAGNKISVSERSIIGQLADLLFNSNQILKGEKEGRINVLLIAIGGQGHSGEELADTIMVASIRPADKKVALLSIPRDLYVQIPGEEYYTKINAVHAYGENKRKNLGPQMIKQKVEEITGLPIHYYGRVDFQAFKHLVDAVGGINITIPNTFYDYWHKISFSAGTEKMNGERALAYVRARYIEGPEGGDFRRAARQQQVLMALRDRVFSVQTALDFSAANRILNSLSDNIRTDLQLWEMEKMYELIRGIENGQVHNVVLTTGPKGLLVGSTATLGGVSASVLRPRTGNYAEIQELANDIFSKTSSETPPPADQQIEPSPSPSPPSSTVEIRNGTTINGLAARLKEKLTEKRYAVAQIGNALNRSYEKTTVFALNLDRADDAKKLAEMLEVNSDSGVPKGEQKSGADILIILGRDAEEKL